VHLFDLGAGCRLDRLNALHKPRHLATVSLLGGPTRRFEVIDALAKSGDLALRLGASFAGLSIDDGERRVGCVLKQAGGFGDQVYDAQLVATALYLVVDDILKPIGPLGDARVGGYYARRLPRALVRRDRGGGPRRRNRTVGERMVLGLPLRARDSGLMARDPSRRLRAFRAGLVAR